MDKSSMRENRIHGNSMFPLMVYYSESPQGENLFDCHWHNEMELLLITKGKVLIQIENAYCELSEGQAAIIGSGDIHAAFAIDHSPCSFKAIVFNQDILSSQSYDIMQEKYMEPLKRKIFHLPSYLKGEQSWEKDIINKFNEIFKIYSGKKLGYELSIKALLYLILSDIFSNDGFSSRKERTPSEIYQSERLKSVLNYIHENYSKKLTIKDMSQIVNMSEGHFCRFFKQMVRRTPIDYLNNYRMNEATKLLLEKDKKIFEVALDVGFDNFSYFINIFKHYLNCTPSQYRNKIRN